MAEHGSPRRQPWREAMAPHSRWSRQPDRSLDGAPALALTFSQPLDARKSYDSFIQVFEMPPRPEEAKPKKEDADQEEDEDSDEAKEKAKNASNVSTAPADTDAAGGQAVPGSWVVGDNPRLLFFPHIKPETRYVVRIAPGLPAVAAGTLAAESRYSIRTAAVSPAYYFASRGTVLPAKQNGGLPVVTVNVPDVDVQFLKVRNDQLPRFLDRVVSAPRGKQDEDSDEDSENRYDRNQTLAGAVSLYDLDTLHKMTDSVYAGRFVTEQRANRRAVTFIPVEDIKELQEPGIYVAVMSQPGRFRYDYQTTYFYVSDLGLHMRLFAKGADAYVSSLTDGKAVAKVEVSWLDAQGKILARGESDGDGHTAFAERPKGAKVITARKGSQVSLIALKEPALDLSEYDITGLPYKPVRLFAYSGRNLYRPGENFEVAVVARDGDGHPVPKQPIQALLKRPDGRTQSTAAWQPDATFTGFYRRKIDVPIDAPTGFWTLELRSDPADKVPGTVFRFGVEEFLPERMKMDLDAPAAIMAGGEPFNVSVKGAYLYGAPAAGNRLLGVVQFERNRNPLVAKLPGFEFGDANEDTVRNRVELPEDKLDAEGKGTVEIDLDSIAKRHSPFVVRTTLSLLESGGRPVVRSIERTYWPAPVVIGVRPLFTGDYAREDTLAQFEVVRADMAGNLKAGNALPVRLFREDRNYYWRFDDQRGWSSGFTETDELVETASVTIPAAGRGKLSLPVKYGRYRMEIVDPETSQTLRYRFYAGWSARTDEAQGVRPDRVALKLDKPGYREGDTAQVTILPPHAGEMLVTVEGDRTLWLKRMSVSAEGTTVAIPISKDWARHDLYVSALVLRPGDAGDKVTPARALGLVYLPLERGDRKLTVTLDAPKKMQPDNTLKIKVKVPEAKGDKAVVTISAVDAGILNITRFATPDPFAFFFGQLRYGADLYDVYGRLIEKMAGQKGKLKFGGDNTPKATRSLPKKVKLVDLFSGPVAVNDQGEAEISLAVPDFNGTLRLMAVVSGTERYGSQDAEVIVAAPLVAELATPRFLTFGDVGTLALDLTNLSGHEQRLKVTVGSGDGLKVRDPARAVVLKDQQKTTLRFPVEAGTIVSLVPITVSVDSDDLKIKRDFALQVEAPTAQQQVVRRYIVNPGDTLDMKDADLSGFHRQTALANLVVSNRAPIDVRAAIEGLLVYPYGCAEQTTSSAYPWVFVDEDAARAFGLRPFTREARAQAIDKAISRLSAMQAPNGGFSLWGNASDYEYWLSAYVTNFLQDARDQGFNVPEQMQKKAMDFLLRGLQEGMSGLPTLKPDEKLKWDPEAVWRDRRYGGSGRFGVLAYGAYVLARESKAPLATLRQLHDSRGLAYSGLSLVQLGLALKLMGDDPRANVAIAEGVKKPRSDGYWWGDYGSTLRDAALSYVLLDRAKVEVEGKENLIATVSAELESHKYYSTQEKMALFLVGRALAGGNGPWVAELSVGGKTDSLAASDSQFRVIAPADLASGIHLKNTDKARLFVELSLSGNPIKPPAPRADPIALTREWYAPDGTPIGNRALKVGESVMVRLLVKTRTRVVNGLVVDRIPAGLEIENLNIVQGEQLGGGTQIAGMDPAQAMADLRIQHVEFRDDRFVAAVKLDGELNLFYRARVVTPGKFVIPPLYGEDMYRPDIFGVTGGADTVTIVDAQNPAQDAKQAAAASAPAAATAAAPTASRCGRGGTRCGAWHCDARRSRRARRNEVDGDGCAASRVVDVVASRRARGDGYARPPHRALRWRGIPARPLRARPRLPAACARPRGAQRRSGGCARRHAAARFSRSPACVAASGHAGRCLAALS